MILTSNLAKKTEALILKKGDYVNGTREITGFNHNLNIPRKDASWASRIGADIDLMCRFYECVKSKDLYFVEKSYASRFYECVPEGIEYAASCLKTDGVFTRRAIVSFPRDHCFESIQVLVRPLFVGPSSGSTYRYEVVVHMRSCNVVVNFANDLYLADKIAKDVLDAAFGFGHEIKPSVMHVHIGSLHKFILEK